MKCSSVRKLISDYIDNNLDSKKTFTVERHLDTCPDCKHLLEDFQGIIKDAKDLKEISPSEKTWLELKAKLESKDQRTLELKPRREKRFSFLIYPPKLKYALSSALLAAVIVVAVTVGLKNWRGKNVLEREALQKYTLAKLNEAEHHYQLAIKALGEALYAQEGNIDPQIAKVFRANLEIIDSSILTCRQIVLQEPDNFEARNYLLTAYRGKVDFLNGMIEMQKSSSQKKELKTSI